MNSKINSEIEGAFSDPGSIKSGEYLKDHLEAILKNNIDTNRKEIIEIIQKWLALLKDPETILAIIFIGELKLSELGKSLKKLKSEIITTKKDLYFYMDWIDKALSKLN